MELGNRLKQARLEAGLSQRQLCGDEITRNMLSLIENGSARPSMDTLCYLAARLEKPVSYFLEETPVPSGEQFLHAARQAFQDQKYADALELLEKTPDPLSAPEHRLLQVLCLLALAEEAIEARRIPYALELLRRAGEAGSDTPYYTPELHRRHQILSALAAPEQSAAIAAALTDDAELLLRAQAALQSGDHARCAALLDSAADRTSPRWCLMKGDALFAMKNYADAAACYLQVEDLALSRLEQCYLHMEDYKSAYFYACKQRK